MFTYKHFSAGSVVLEPFGFTRELAMEAYILENAKVLSLDKDDFGDVKILESELAVRLGRDSKDGRIDILASYGDGYIAVVELKAGQLSRRHFSQLQEYLKKKEKITELVDYDEGMDSKSWLGLLVGTSIETELALEISKGLRTENGVPIAAITINRFRGEEGQVYVISDVFSAIKKSEKDRTKYEFEGATYGKGRLVQAVLKSFVAKNPSTDYSTLEAKFPSKLQSPSGGVSRFGVFKRVGSEETKLSDGYPQERYFMKPEDIIALGDGTKVVVCSQWGLKNINGFIKCCEKIGLKIRPRSG